MNNVIQKWETRLVPSPEVGMSWECLGKNKEVNMTELKEPDGQ